MNAETAVVHDEPVIQEGFFENLCLSIANERQRASLVAGGALAGLKRWEKVMVVCLEQITEVVQFIFNACAGTIAVKR